MLTLHKRIGKSAIAAAIVAALGLGGVVASAGTASAWSGGGCANPTYSTSTGGAWTKFDACISGGGNGINPDAYLYFAAPSPNLWANCIFEVYAYDNTTHTYLEGRNFDVTGAARQNLWGAHYALPFQAVWGGQSFYTYADFYGYYNGNYVWSNGSFSPLEYS